MGDDVAVLHFQLALEDVCVGRVANGNEAALQREVFGVAVLRALDAHAGHSGDVAQHFIQGEEGLEHDLAGGHFLHHLVYQNRFGLELVAPVDERDLAGDI